MEKQLLVSCECKGTGFIAVVDKFGDDVEHVECGTHNPAYNDAPSVEPITAKVDFKALNKLDLARAIFANTDVPDLNSYPKKPKTHF
jgi:hypothetical protein